MTTLDLRPSPIAGTWYEGNADALARAVDDYLNRAKLPALDGEVIGVIAPHAGHRYSGAVAGHAFAAVRSLRPELVAVISPFHNFAPYPLIATAHDAYATPLGNIEVDKLALRMVGSRAGIPITPAYADKEHSLEIELPFLQRALTGGFKLLPIMIHTQEPEVAHKLGLALAETLKGKNALLVASTDLSHFYDQQTAERLDREMLRRFEAFDPESIFDAEQTGKAFACGHAAVAAVLWAAREFGANKVKVLHHATSGDVAGDYSSVVGYGAAAVLRG
jgi:AmmeMemoRadiSam system protein B